MKTLVVMPKLEHPGGVTTFYSNLRKHLDANSISYFEFWSSRDGGCLVAFFFNIIKNNLRFLSLLAFGRYTTVCINPSMGGYSIIRDSIFLLLCWLFCVRTVCFFHGWNQSFVDKLRKGRFFFLFKYVFFKNKSIVVLSEQFRIQLLDWGYEGQIHVMTTHVPDELMEKNVADRKEVEKDVFAPFNILFLSRVEEAKGIRETLQAYQIAKERRPAITLTCAGGGEELAYWKDFSAQHGIDVRGRLPVVHRQLETAVLGLADAFDHPAHP